MRLLFAVVFLLCSFCSRVEALDYAPYASVLKQFGNTEGRVDYKNLLGHRAELDKFVLSVAALPPAAYEKMDANEKLAFWINAYNALILRTVIDNYPIRPTALKSFVYPKNSIRQIPKVFDAKTVMVMGRKMSFDDIQNNVLRKDFGDPRINFALACGALSCPHLYPRPFEGADLENQLSECTQAFMERADNAIKLDEDTKNASVPGLFKEAGKDFEKKYGTAPQFNYLNPMDRAVMNFIAQNSEPKTKKILNRDAYFIIYRDFDWTLNDQQ